MRQQKREVLLELGLCGCYEDRYCYADCGCSNCEGLRGFHLYRGVILGGQRYFQVKDFRPDHPIYGVQARVETEDGTTRQPVGAHPEALVAKSSTMMFNGTASKVSEGRKA